MAYYSYKNHVIYTEDLFSGQPLNRLPETGEVIWLFRRPPLAGRETFAVTDPALLTVSEGPETLDASTPAPPLPPELTAAIAAGRVRAVNGAHPRWEELLNLPPRREKVRVSLLALGDVGSTLAMGLKLLGGDVISTLGLCDVREKVPERWEFELGQIATELPRVEIVRPEAVFDCDVFLFCASRFVPDTAVKSGDVRMAQYALNRPLVVNYARMAREKGFQGMFCVVSDPVDPLCRAVLMESNRDEAGRLDGRGLSVQQVRGFGLGVMHARARYYAARDPRFRDYLADGRAFGPHGEGLIIANSIAHYDDKLSRELTELTKGANLQMRAWGYKPYAAPALSSGALSLLACLRGEWQYSSVFLDGIYFGVRNRLTPDGCEVEQLDIPAPLAERIRETAALLKGIE